MSFLDELQERGIVKENQLTEIKRQASQKFDGNLDETLVSLGITDEKTLLNTKSAYFKIPYKLIDQKNISFDVLKYIPEDSATHYKFAPIGILDDVLEVGITDPENIQAMDALQFISSKNGIPFKIFLITPSDFKKIMDGYRGVESTVGQALADIDTQATDISADEVLAESKKVQENLKPGEEEKIVEDAPIVKIVAVILRTAIEGRASDIHIENTGENVKVRFRVDGELHTSLVLPLNVYNGVVARIKILSKLRLDEKRKPQDGGFSAKIEGRKIDFRVSSLPSYYGEAIAMRILDAEKGVKSLDDLHMSKENIEMIREAIKRPYGLVLITGPTGSGKTTTLYAMLNELDREANNVVSLEDPVEYHIPQMNQSQVMPEIGYTFATGLRSILRQDPNIIMVGEIRDKETAQLAIQAALTGHLVLSTLHTNSAIGVVPRLVDMGVDPYLIAPTLILAVAQRLSKMICPTSKNVVPIDEAMKSMFEKQFADLPEEYKSKINIGEQIYEAKPSAECPTGTKERIAIFEMFKIDKEMQNVILKTPNEGEIYKVARKKGMITMKEDAILKAINGEIPYQEVYNF
ncbi:MAG: GspE/PulE family protein [Candidatus Paceibacterota bacterium]|jgi:type IV pilus assembly protein PilB